MSLRSTVNWGNDVPYGWPVETDEETDEETEVELIIDASNPQTDPMDIDIEEPIGRQSHGQAEGRQQPRQQTEVREENLLRSSNLYNGFSGSRCASQALAMGQMVHRKHRTQ
jgi:hypothetical protein